MLLTAVPIGGTRGFIRGAARNPSPIKTVEISVRSPRTRLLTRHRADSGRDIMKETVIRVEDQPLPRPVDDGSLEWAPGVGVGLPDRVRDGEPGCGTGTRPQIGLDAPHSRHSDSNRPTSQPLCPSARPSSPQP